MFSRPISKTGPALWILMVAGFILYTNTLNHDFNLDDTYYTAGNQFTEQGWKSIPGIFSEPTIYGPKGIGYDYRPVTATSFIIQHELLGSTAAAGHWVNLCLYLLTIMVLFRLLAGWNAHKNAVNLAFWISLLFLVHPLHTEVVASIKSRDELLALLFSLLSLRFWGLYFRKQKIYLAVLAPVFMVLALFSKYTVVPFLFYIPLALYFFYGLTLRKAFLVFGVLLATGIGCHLLKNSILPDFDHYFSITENGLVAKQYNISNRIATSFYIMGRYLLLHLFPVKLVYYYGYSYVPVVGWSSVPAILSLFFHLALVAWCFLNRHKKSLLLFGVLLYLGHIIIYSNLIELAPGMMAERFAYAASMGFCISIVLLVFTHVQPVLAGKHLLAAPVLLTCVVLALGARTVMRNQNWKNKESLYAHDVKEAPRSAMLNYLYGDFLLATSVEQKKNAIIFKQYSPSVEQQIKERLRESQAYFTQTLLINPADTLAQYNLASSYIQLDDFKTAERLLSQTVKQFPLYAEACFTLGLSQVYQKKWRESIGSFEKLLQIDSGFVIGYEQLNRAQLAIGDTAAALATLDRAMQVNPASPVPLAEMANFWLQAKDTTKAIGFAERAAQLPPANQGLLLFLKNYFSMKGLPDKADYYLMLLQKTAAPL